MLITNLILNPLHLLLLNDIVIMTSMQCKDVLSYVCSLELHSWNSLLILSAWDMLWQLGEGVIATILLDLYVILINVPDRSQATWWRNNKHYIMCPGNIGLWRRMTWYTSGIRLLCSGLWLYINGVHYMNPSLFHRFEGDLNRSLKNYGFLYDAIFSSHVRSTQIT